MQTVVERKCDYCEKKPDFLVDGKRWACDGDHYAKAKDAAFKERDTKIVTVVYLHEW